MPRSISSVRVVLLLGLVWLAAACARDELHTVGVVGLSDFVPGPEAAKASTAIFLMRGESRIERAKVTTRLRFGDALSRGIRIATFDSLVSSDYMIDVSLLRSDDTLLVKRSLLVTISHDGNYTVSLTADCAALECPNAGGSPAFSQCLGGQCVDPRCSVDTPEFCPENLFCHANAECAQDNACATTECVSGVCTSQQREGACAETEYCNSEGACAPRDMSMMMQPGDDWRCGRVCAPEGRICWYGYYTCVSEGEPVCSTFVARPAGAPCGDALVCDGAGACVSPQQLDAGVDAAMPIVDASLDAALDARVDSMPDAEADAAEDAEADALVDAPMDTSSFDAPPLPQQDADIDDASLDAPTLQDASFDAPAPQDAATDANEDAALDASREASADATVAPVNECETLTNPCFSGVTCTDLPVGYSCGACPIGYNGDGRRCVAVACGQPGFVYVSGTGCTDVDECAEGTDLCDARVTCTNTEGGYLCGDCPAGYAGGGLSGCTDIDECMAGGCSELVECENTPGSFSCDACPSGYEGNGVACTDIDECANHTATCGTNQACDNDDGSYACVCASGAHECSSACVLNTSVATCGTSCTPCATDAHGVATCNGTSCGITCNSGYSMISGSCQPPWVQQAYLKAASPGANDLFGGTQLALSSDGNTLVVAAWTEDSAATGVNGDATSNAAADSGAAYVFVRDGSTWTQQAYLKASNAQAGDAFGTRLAISADGNTVAIGAVNEASNATTINGDQTNNSAPGAGAVYVFTRSGTTWTQQAYIKANNADSWDWFGVYLALSDDGNTLGVGAGYEGDLATGINGTRTNNGASDSGAAYIFVRSGNTWTQEAYFKAPNCATTDLYGISVALSSTGDTFAVGAWQEDSAATGIDGDQSSNAAVDSGAVYVYTRSSGTWTLQSYIKASNTSAGDHFSQSLALASDGNTLIVTAFDENGAATGINGDQASESATDSGAAYVFVRSSGVWSQQAYIKASNTAIGDRLGISASISSNGDLFIVGAAGEDSNATGVSGDQTNNSASSSGAAYVFARSGTTWSQQAYVKASIARASLAFGDGVAISGDGATIAVGAPGESSSASGIGGSQTDQSVTSSGAVYVFRRSQ